MSDSGKPPRPSHPESVPPEVPAELDSSWDDDTMPQLQLDDPMSESVFDRVTAVPELPAEVYAKQLMDLDSPPATMRGSALGARREEPEPPLELDLGDVARSGPPPPVLMPSAASSPREAQIRKMKDHYAMGDFTGALVVAEGLLELNGDDIDAQRYAKSCRDVLTQMYSARLGALTRRVRVAVPLDQIRWLSLDHRAGFMLSLIDGSSTVEEVLDISGMNRLDALRILYTLFDQRVIALS